MANIILPKGAFEEIKSGANIEEFGFAGRVKVQVTNKHGRLIKDERVHNDVFDDTRNKLRNAILLHLWDWDGSDDYVNQLAFHSYKNSFGVPHPLLGNGISWSQTPTSIIVGVNTSGGGYRCTFKGNGVASVSGSTISLTSHWTGIAATFHQAEMGIASAYVGGGFGVVTWANQWAAADISDVTIAGTDTVTITWTLTLS